MIDSASRDDFLRIRQGRGRHPAVPEVGSEEGSPAFVGRVTSSGSALGVGKYLMVRPTAVLGVEVEGGSGTISDVGSSSIPVYLVGPGLPSAGDFLICKFVDNRWVAERDGGKANGGGKVGSIPNCFCDPIPSTLTMTSADPRCNYGMFQNAKLQYGPIPPAYAPLFLGANCYLSVESFPDATLGGALFQYLLTCQFNQFGLGRVYEHSPYGSPFRDGILYSWSVGGYGNSCVPFHLFNGVAFPGSDASCSVTIQGG